MKRKNKISIRILVGILMMVVVLSVSSGIALSTELKRAVIDSYSNYALTYVRAAAAYIDGDTVSHYLGTGEKDKYYTDIQNYLESTVDASKQQIKIDYFYVFVPGDEDITYIWDMELEEEPMELLEHYPYSDESAKENANSIMSGEINTDITNYFDGGTLLLTASVPLLDSSGNPVAIVAADLSVDGINEAGYELLINVSIPIIILMILIEIIYYFYSRKKLVTPIVKLQKATEEIVDNLGNNTSFKIDIHTNDEIEMLAKSFEKMNEKLHDYIIQNETITAEKERIETELSLATRIQADMLPNIFPAFPDRTDFDIYASMTPAKEVGGDFYDFFLIDDDHLGIVMADVSGKGVPAALFMMMSKILIKNQAMISKSPQKILKTVNEQVCANNREEMFVTVWLGILDLKTGVLTAANAGHEKPIIKKHDGDFEVYSDKHGFIIGGMSGISYKEYEIKLEKGSKLFVYTDGAVEATDSQNKLFGTERLLASLNSVKNSSTKEILETVHKDVDLFVGDAPQFDDLTMMCIEYIGSDKETLVVDAENDNLHIVMDFVDSFLEKNSCPMNTQMKIDLSVEEIYVNIANYAYGGGKGDAQISIENNDGNVKIVFSDSGTPYNPLEKPDPDTTLSSEERQIGGLGVFLVKKNMDDVTYEHKNGKNVLTMIKNIK